MPTSLRIRYKGRGRTGGVEPRPLRKRNKRCNGRATARVAPTKALQGVRERNPPVTASPCQPPLGKGAERTGDADVPVAVPKISALPYGERLKF